MISVKRKGYRGDGSGVSWPKSSPVVRSIFGDRPFAFHVGTLGFNNDFHRGVDVQTNDGDPMTAMTNGAVSRRNYTFFGFENALHLNEFSAVNNSSSLATALGTNALTLTCSRVGAKTFPTQIDKFQSATEHIDPTTNDWIVEMNLAATISTSPGGVLGLGAFDADHSEYIAIEYNGTTFTTYGVGTTTFAANGGTHTISGAIWFRVTYTQSTTTYTWDYSTDTSGQVWVNLASETGRTFTNAAQARFSPAMFWRSTDTNATPYTINISQFNWQDSSTTIGRFGNFLQLTNSQGGFKVFAMHFQTLLVKEGDFVSAGQLIGYSGTTGYDATSGRIINEHQHIEYAPNTNYDYGNNDSVNILDSSLLPRANVNNNVNVVRTSGNDPNSNASHILTITVTRNDNDFDFNEVSLTGNLGTIDCNMNTRAGIDPADADIPVFGGLYIVASSMDNTSSTYICTFYFNTATVGSTFVSYTVKDTAGTILASG